MPRHGAFLYGTGVNSTDSGTRAFFSYALAVAALAAVTWLVYWPGLSGQFLLDDYSSILSNHHLLIDHIDGDSLRAAALSGHSGPLKRPIAYLSFAVNAYLAGGFDPFQFKLTNLLIHLVAGIGIFLLTRSILGIHTRLTGADPVSVNIAAFATAAFWMLHPINLTAVLYAVQRMTSLAALFTIGALLAWVWGRARLIEGRPGMALALPLTLLCTALSLLSKETGALIPLYILALELTVLNFEAPRPRQRMLLKAGVVGTVALPALAVLVHVVNNPDWILRGYVVRDFTLYERLLTETRVLWFYIALMLAPRASAMGLFHDDFPVSHGLLDPPSTLIAVIGLAGLAAGAVLLRRRAPVLSLGLLLFLMGHLLESTVFSLELVFEHRNYFPSFGIMLILGYYLTTAALSTRTLRIRRISAAAVGLLFALVTLNRASLWGDPLDHAAMEALAQPESPRALTQLASTYTRIARLLPDETDRYYPLARQTFLKAAALRPDVTNPLFGLLKAACELQKPVDRAWAEELVHRLNTQPYHINNINWLEIVGNYNGTEKCTMPPALMEPMILASLNNADMTDGTRALLYVTAARFYAYRADDPERAIELLDKAIDLRPSDPRPWIHKASLMNHLGRPDDALAALTSAQALDRLGEHRLDIAQQRKAAETNGPAARS